MARGITFDGKLDCKNGKGTDMFRASGLAVLVPLLALAGCGSQDSADGGDAGPAAGEQATINVVVPNPYQKQLLALNETNRKLALRRAVQDDGGSCRSIKSARFQQEYNGMAMWVASCAGGDWAVYLAPSGIVQVRACKDSRELGLPECILAAEEKSLQPLWSKDSNPLPPPVNQM